VNKYAFLEGYIYKKAEPFRNVNMQPLPPGANVPGIKPPVSGVSAKPLTPVDPSFKNNATGVAGLVGTDVPGKRSSPVTLSEESLFNAGGKGAEEIYTAPGFTPSRKQADKVKSVQAYRTLLNQQMQQQAQQ
jgi:hypothetical protein